MKLERDQKILYSLVVLIVIFALVNVWFLFSTPFVPGSGDDTVIPSTEGKTELISIVSSNCPDCVDLSILTQQISSLGIDFSERELVFETDSEAQELISAFGIEKLPGMIIKANSTDFETLSSQWTSIGSIEENNILVLEQVPLPYFDIASQSTKGLVELWSIEKSDCTDCSPVIGSAQMAALGITVSQENLLLDSDAEAQALIEQYAITKLPALILSQEVNDYDQLVQMLEVGGEFLESGTWVMRSPAPYYWDLNEDKLVGGISLTRLGFDDCNECFNLQELEDFFVQSFGFKIATDENKDWGTEEGKQFAMDYNITKIPTLVFGGELFAYPGLEENWENFGFIAVDGKLVFSEHERLGADYPFFDIDTNSVVTPEALS